MSSPAFKNRRPGWWPNLTRDGWVLVATYSLRLAAYACVSVILGVYLGALGFAPALIGLIFTAAVAGGGVMTAILAALADRWGRRRVLVIGALLMAASGAIFATTTSAVLFVAAAVVGSISPSGSEVGPFLSIEQAMLPSTTGDTDRTKAFSAYNVVGQGVGALGAAAAAVPSLMGADVVSGSRWLMWTYAAIALLLALLFSRLSARVEVSETERRPQSNERTQAKATIVKFAGLYALDSLGSGFVVQGLVFYWFNLQYGIDIKGLGAIAVGADVLAAISFAAAPWVASHVGLLLAAILPHVVANVLVVLVPLMPVWWLAVGVWLLRYAFAQMERPARQSYTMAILPEDQRAGASGVMSVARNAAAAVGPYVSGALLSVPALGLPFIAAGCIKLVYDTGLFLMFRGVHPPEEKS